MHSARVQTVHSPAYIYHIKPEHVGRIGVLCIVCWQVLHIPSNILRLIESQTLAIQPLSVSQ